MGKHVHKITNMGVLELCESEGVVLGPYKDSKGIWTYGVGHTKAAGGPNPELMPRTDTRGFTDKEVENEILDALELFDSDLDKYEARVNRALHVKVKKYQFDALMDFDFNTGGIFRAKLTSAINNRQPDASKHFMGWLRPPEIRERRENSMDLFNTGNYHANGDKIAVWDALGDGRLKFRKSISGKELKELMDKSLSRRSVATGPSLLNLLLKLIMGIFK